MADFSFLSGVAFLSIAAGVIELRHGIALRMASF